MPRYFQTAHLFLRPSYVAVSLAYTYVVSVVVAAASLQLHVTEVRVTVLVVTVSVVNVVVGAETNVDLSVIVCVGSYDRRQSLLIPQSETKTYRTVHTGRLKALFVDMHESELSVRGI